MNSLAKTDKEFHCSREYNWYSDLRAKNISSKYLRDTRLVKDGCVPKVFGVPKFVLWCLKHFNHSRRLIQVGDNTIQPIIQNPLVFQRMLRLPKPNKELNLVEVDDFITNHGILKRLLPYFTDSLSRLRMNSFQFDIDVLKVSLREFSWLFAQITDQESTTLFPRYVLFFLYGTFKMDQKFDLDQIISNEISHQLSNYQQTGRFFTMT